MEKGEVGARLELGWTNLALQIARPPHAHFGQLAENCAIANTNTDGYKYNWIRMP